MSACSDQARPVNLSGRSDFPNARHLIRLGAMKTRMHVTSFRLQPGILDSAFVPYSRKRWREGSKPQKRQFNRTDSRNARETKKFGARGVRILYNPAAFIPLSWRIHEPEIQTRSHGRYIHSTDGGNGKSW